jgi:hypothetical protein
MVFPVPLGPANHVKIPEDEEAPNFLVLADRTTCRVSQAILRNISACFEENDIFDPDRLD